MTSASVVCALTDHFNCEPFARSISFVEHVPIGEETVDMRTTYSDKQSTRRPGTGSCGDPYKTINARKMYYHNFGTLFGTAGGDLAEMFGLELKSNGKGGTRESQVDELDSIASLVERPIIYFAREMRENNRYSEYVLPLISPACLLCISLSIAASAKTPSSEQFTFWCLELAHSLHSDF